MQNLALTYAIVVRLRDETNWNFHPASTFFLKPAGYFNTQKIVWTRALFRRIVSRLCLKKYDFPKIKNTPRQYEAGTAYFAEYARVYTLN